MFSDNIFILFKHTDTVCLEYSLASFTFPTFIAFHWNKTKTKTFFFSQQILFPFASNAKYFLIRYYTKKSSSFFNIRLSIFNCCLFRSHQIAACIVRSSHSLIFAWFVVSCELWVGGMCTKYKYIKHCMSICLQDQRNIHSGNGSSVHFSIDCE